MCKAQRCPQLTSTNRSFDLTINALILMLSADVLLPSATRIQCYEKRRPSTEAGALTKSQVSGDYRAEVTPVPIPNTAVKLRIANDTAWVTAWESSTSPG